MASILGTDVVADAAPRAAAKLRTRRILVRVHMWIALSLGAYIVVLSLSGSAIVFRREFNTWLVPRTVASTEGVRLTGDSLTAAVRATYPTDVVVEVREPQAARAAGVRSPRAR